MANADYVERGSGSFATVAVLSQELAPLAAQANITNLKTDGADMRTVGMAAMIGEEIVRVDAIGTGSITIARGCADTVPALHPPGTPVWFFGLNVGTDGTEYFGTQAIAVKVIPRTPSKILEVAKSPPRDITFRQRFIRPYPPSDVRVGGLSVFTTSPRLTAGAPNMVLTWGTRNRVLQADQLIGHTEASVTPEVGTTHRVRLYSSAGDLVRTIDLGSALTLTLERGPLGIDLGVSDEGDVSAHLMLDSVRDGHASLHAVRINFVLDTDGLGLANGWGVSWGAAWG